MHGKLRVAAIGTVLLVALVTSGCGATGNGAAAPTSFPTGDGTTTPDGDLTTYTGNGVSFSYPKEWTEQDLGPGAAEEGAPLWQVSVTLDDALNNIAVREYALSVEVNAETISSVEPSVTQVVESLTEQVGGTITSGPEQVEVGGLPALRYDTSFDMPDDGTPVQDTSYFVFDGMSEYFILCQWTAEKADVVNAACADVTGSFTVT